MHGIGHRASGGGRAGLDIGIAHEDVALRGGRDRKVVDNDTVGPRTEGGERLGEIPELEAQRS